MLKSHSHSQHNYEASEFLLNDGNYLDWVITTSFYSALHLVQEDIFPFRDNEAFEYSSFEQYYSKNRDNGIRVSKHQSTIKLVEQRIKGAGTLYRNLHDLCKTCRYSNYHVSKKKAKIAKSYLDKIRVLVSSNTGTT